MSRILYKYLDIKGGKAMLGNKTLQYTNATQLNDPFDCHPKLLDFSNVPSDITHGPFSEEWWQKKEENRALNKRNETWLTSFSKKYDSLLMWAHYCYNHKGICIGLDIDKVLACVPPLFGTVFLEPLVLEVNYVEILKRPDKFNNSWDYQFQTKAKEWEYEQEVRLVMDKPHPMYAAFTPEQAKEAKEHKDKVWDWKEIHHYQPLCGDCFESIYFGINIDPIEKKKIINYTQEQLNPNIKLYQMAVDENALRLKAEEITDKF